MSSLPPQSESPIPDDASPSDTDDANNPTGDSSMPLTMAASVILTALPPDAHQALANAGALPQAKVTVRFQAVGSAPQLRQRVFKISSSQRFATVVNFLRRRLGIAREESVFCYVNNVFAPGLDEGVGNLWRCFRTGEELVVGYARTPAFG